MKKISLILLTVMLGVVSSAWAQYNQTFTASYSLSGELVYNGSQQTGFSVSSANCDYNVTGDKATNAGSYTGVISSDCGGHYLSLGGYDQIVWDHIGTINVNWEIKPCELTDQSVTIEVQDVQWTGYDIPLSSAITKVEFKGSALTKGTDYDVIVTKESIESNIKDEGRYTAVFTGKGNFTGTVTRIFDVKKDMTKSEDITGVHYDIPEQILVDGETFEFNYEVTDRKSHTKLYVDEDFTVKLYSDEACTTEATSITVEGKYWAEFTGKAPKYDEATKMKKAFYVVKEYQEEPAKTVDAIAYPAINMRITKAGYPVALDSPDGQVVRGEMQVAAKTTGDPAIAADSKCCEIPATVEITVTDKLTYNVVGVENNAFSGCLTLRWINSNISDTFWTPSSLDRTVVDTPFYGLPKQTIIYLFGSTIKGENYVYKVTSTDYRSERYHIYEDISGSQTNYSDAE